MAEVEWTGGCRDAGIPLASRLFAPDPGSLEVPGYQRRSMSHLVDRRRWGGVLETMSSHANGGGLVFVSAPLRRDGLGFHGMVFFLQHTITLSTC